MFAAAEAQGAAMRALADAHAAMMRSLDQLAAQLDLPTINAATAPQNTEPWRPSVCLMCNNSYGPTSYRTKDLVSFQASCGCWGFGLCCFNGRMYDSDVIKKHVHNNTPCNRGAGSDCFKCRQKKQK
jgi:hypothetical protein